MLPIDELVAKMQRHSVLSTLAIVACGLVVHAQRTRSTFDFDWKFYLGSPAAGQCNTSSFPVTISGVQCLELTQQAATDATACLENCCLQGGGCSLWQYEASAGCWTGNGCANNLTGNGWVGGERAGPVPSQCNDPTDPCNPTYDDSTWRSLNVPHDFAIEGTFNPAIDPSKGSLAKNVSWYRKSFTLPSNLSNSLVWLQFDGVFRSADVYINGAFVMHHEEGYTSFNAYIHNASVPLNYGTGENVLAVFVDATQSELWCYEGGGIYRHVWLESAGAVSIVPWGLYVPSVVTGTITSPQLNLGQQTADAATVIPQVDIQNAGSSAMSGKFSFQLLDETGYTVANGSAPFNVSAGGWQRVSLVLPFGSSSAPVQLWNAAPGGVGAYLYLAEATLLDSTGNEVDRLGARIGVRSAIFSPTTGFMLNGMKVMLQGTSNHLGFGGVGMAVPDRVAEYHLASLAAIGQNAWRTAHNPVAPELLDFADKYGMLVWSENRFVTAGVQPLASPMRGGPRARATSPPPSAPPIADPRLLQDAQDMVLRDRNHPSIVIWSLCNELGCVADSVGGGDLGIQFKLKIYAADGTRPVTGNTVQSPYLSGNIVDGFAMSSDVQSFSYEYGAYEQFHFAYPWKAVGGGESASCFMDRGYYAPRNRTSGHTPPDSTYFACVQDSWASAVALPYVYGNFAWTGMDYMGEVYPLGWPDVSSHFGILDLAGYPKDGVGYYQAWWAGEPTGNCNAISISPTEWTRPVDPGVAIDVVAFTCAASAALFVNGVAVGQTQSVPQFGFVTWPKVQFAPGNISAVAYDSTGVVVAMTLLKSAGSAVGIRVWVESPYKSPRNGSVIAADGQDAALIGVAVVDSQGIVMPTGNYNVSFTVSGPAVVIGVANGDPADHSPPKATWRLTFSGLARAIIASAQANAAGPITVTATAEGLVSGYVGLSAEAAY